MKNEERTKVEELLREIKSRISTAGLTVIVFLILELALRFLFRIPFPFMISYLLVFWLLTIFIFSWLIKTQKTCAGINNIHFGYFVFELSMLTVLIHYIGGIEWIGAIFYIFTIIYANFFLSRKKGLLITLIAFTFFTGLVFLEYFEIIPHYDLFSITGLYKDFSYIVTTLLPIAGGAFILISLATGIFADRLKEKTRELVVAYQSLEKTKASLEIKVKERTGELEKERVSLEEKVKGRTQELKELIEKQEKMVQQRTKELQEKVKELERFQKLAVGRELKMIELKKEIEKFKKPLNSK